MTSPGDSSDNGASEPDWIDQILARANDEVNARNETGSVATHLGASTAQSSVVPNAANRPVTAPIVSNGDTLGEIRWVDQNGANQASVSSASSATSTATTETTLTAEAVGRSAWDEELATIGTDDPEGWDQLSWQDLDDAAPSQGVSMSQPSGFGTLIREWGPVLFASVFIALFTRLVLVQAYHIPSESMVPTLEDGDRVVVNRLSYQFGEIERGQVVVFAKPAGTDGENDLIKRVIGLPGETVRFVDNQVYIDGFRVEEPYLNSPDSTRPRLRIPGCDQDTPAPDSCTIPEGYVFVMGDNRLGSSDSRVFGPIPTDTVVGRAFMRVWPLNHLGEL